jgi:quercetin dioxygenase-like cupin family protein
MSQPAIFQFDEIAWVDERAEAHPSAPEEMLAEAERTGAKRKRIARGECGYFSQYTTMPPGFEVPGHSHDHDELFIVLAGGCRLTTGGKTLDLQARDSAALAAGREYGFVVGPEGIEFMVIRPGEAGAAYS